jgi:hypothetical protein
MMQWVVGLHDDFVPEFNELGDIVKDELVAVMRALETTGSHLSRPHADTLNGSRHANMKELRFAAENGAWRFAFAFDTQRQAIILCGGDKSGGGEKRFYKRLIAKADDRFDAHLAGLKDAKGKKR